MEMYSIYHDITSNLGCIITETTNTVASKNSEGYFEFDQSFTDKEMALRILDEKNSADDNF